jgi:hypothetical protein
MSSAEEERFVEENRAIIASQYAYPTKDRKKRFKEFFMSSTIGRLIAVLCVIILIGLLYFTLKNMMRFGKTEWISFVCLNVLINVSLLVVIVM